MHNRYTIGRTVQKYRRVHEEKRIVTSAKQGYLHLLFIVARFRLLADRTNSRAIGIQCCVPRLFVSMECNVAKRCVLEQKLLLRAYRKSL